MKRRLALLSFLLLAGCMSSDSSMKSWVGHTDADLMSRRGAPDLESQGAGGVRVLTYQIRGDLPCRQSFTVNAAHIVVGYSHNCLI